MSHPTAPLCFPLLFFALLGHISAVSVAHPLTLSPLLVICILPFSRRLSVKHTPLIFLLSLLQRALFCFSSSLFSLWEGCREQIYVGSTSGLLMCSSDRSVYVGGWVSVCVFTCVSLCVCVWGCVYVEQRYGASGVIWVSVKAPPLHKSCFALHLSAFVFLTPCSSSDSLAVCWCLSLAHCCMTVSHHHRPQRAASIPADGGVETIYEFVWRSCSSLQASVHGGGDCSSLKHKTWDLLILEGTAPSYAASLYLKLKYVW